MNGLRLGKYVLVALLLGCHLMQAEIESRLMEALDIDGVPGIQLIRQEWIKYAYDRDGYYLTDPVTGEIVRKSTSTTSKWKKVGYNDEAEGKEPARFQGISPVKGPTSVRSNLGTSGTESNDAQAARLIFKVTSGGILNFSYATECSDFDGLRVYVDGEEIGSTRGGYGADTRWGPNPDDPSDELGRESVEIYGGLAPAGSAYAGTSEPYAHEVIFEFYKDEPSFWDGKYENDDWPEKPIAGEYPYLEDYYADMREYMSFRNQIWLDNFEWLPLKPKLEIGDGELDKELVLNDWAPVQLYNNALSFGYRVRYTLDGTEPNATSLEYQQDELEEQAVMIDQSCVITAMVFTKDNTPLTDTLTSRKVVVKATQPMIKLESINDDEAMVSMTKKYEKNEIRYTLNGMEPNAYSSLYGDKPLSIKQPLTLKAFCTRAGIVPSASVSLVIEQAAKPEKIQVYTTTWGDDEPSHIDKGDGLTVACEAVAGTVPQFSLDDGKSWSAYVSPVDMTFASGKDEASICFRSSVTGKLASEIQKVTVYRGNKEWTIANSDIKAGWNLMTFPISLTRGNERDVFSTMSLFRYDDASDAYVKVEVLKEGDAYWFYHDAKNPADIVNRPLLGATKGAVSLDQLAKGWHAYGEVRDNPSLPGEIVAWKYVNGHFELATELKKGKGYFIYKK